MSHAGQLLRESPALTIRTTVNLTDIIEKNAVTREPDHRERAAALAARHDAPGPTRPRRRGSTVSSPSSARRCSWQTADSSLEAEVPNSRCNSTRRTCIRCCGTCVTTRSSTPPATSLVRCCSIGRIASSDRPYLEVADRGSGIDPANAERIFEPFFTTGAAGTGLGLFISRELCQTNGALLAYEARAGAAAVFRIIFADPRRWQG
jgi:hypothetical protein